MEKLPSVRSTWSRFLVLTALFSALSSHGIGQNQYLTFGTGATPMALSSDYRSNGWNPAHISLSPMLQPDWKSAAAGMEFGARLSSEALNRTDLWDGVLGRSEESIDWQSNEWEDWKNLLAGEEIAFNLDITTTAAAKHWGKWAVAYTSRQHFQAEMLLDVSSVELLLQGGAANWFELIITTAGDTLQNSENNSVDLTDIASGLDLDGDAVLSNLLASTRLGFSWHRAHTVGLSKEWQLESLTLHTGMAGRLLLGNGFFKLDQQDGTLDAFGAFSNGFNIPSLATVSQPTTTQSLRNWGPVGQGWGADIGVALDWNKKIWASAAVTDIGSMEWRGEQYSIGQLALSNWSTPIIAAENWIEIATAALNPTTWFNGSETETRRIKNGTTFHIGGGIHLSEQLSLAADASFDDSKLLGNVGSRMGFSCILQPCSFLRFDAGLSKWGNETIRVPLGLIFTTNKRGFECGLQATDIQGIWKDAQPEIGLRACVMRWVW